jgi:hypothetical protein
MKHGKRILCAAIFSTMSTLAIAQAGGGNGNGGAGGGNAHSAATAGMTSGGDPASGAMSKSGKTHGKMTHKSATDTTNMPGANASSDTKAK